MEWNREELQVLLDLVTAEIARLGRSAMPNEQAALGHLWGKLTQALKHTPSGLAS